MDCAAPSFLYVPLVSIRRRRSQRALSIFRRTLAVRFPKIGCIGSEHLCYLLNVKPGYRFWLSDSNCRVGRTTSPCTLVSRLAEILLLVRRQCGLSPDTSHQGCWLGTVTSV